MPQHNSVCSPRSLQKHSRSPSILRRWTFVASIVATVSFAAGGCAIVDNELSDGMQGYVSFGFEVSAFYPCDSAEQWWVESANELELGERYDAIVSRPYEWVYVRLRGSVSRPGQYGHLGQYQRVLTVSEILEMRLPADSDCGWLGGQPQ